MIDVLGDVNMMAMETEHYHKRLSARNKAIQALEGVIGGTVTEEEYNKTVEEYSDVIESIKAIEAEHLAYKGEENE